MYDSARVNSGAGRGKSWEKLGPPTTTCEPNTNGVDQEMGCAKTVKSNKGSEKKRDRRMESNLANPKDNETEEREDENGSGDENGEVGENEDECDGKDEGEHMSENRVTANKVPSERMEESWSNERGRAEKENVQNAAKNVDVNVNVSDAGIAVDFIFDEGPIAYQTDLTAEPNPTFAFTKEPVKEQSANTIPIPSTKDKPVNAKNTAANSEEEEENEIFLDAEENKDLQDSDTSIQVVDEYIELKTPGAKTLESLTPKPRRIRRNRNQTGNPSGNQASGSVTSPIQVDITENNPEKEGDEESLASKTTKKAAEYSTEPVTVTDPVSCEGEGVMQQSQSMSQPDRPSSTPREASSSVGKNRHDDKDDVTDSNQSEKALEEQIKSANKTVAEREQQGQTQATSTGNSAQAKARPTAEDETVDHSSGTSDTAATAVASTSASPTFTAPLNPDMVNTPVASKPKQARLTMEGAIRKPTSGEESEQQEEMAEKAKAKKKKKKVKPKKDIPEKPAPERKLRSQSTNQP